MILARALLMTLVLSFLATNDALALRVVWWNVGGHYYDDDIQQKEYERLIQNENPDVLILGEYFHGSEKYLEQTFPYKHFKANNNNDETFGVVIFSKVSFSVVDHNEILAWCPENKKQDWEPYYQNESCKFERPFWYAEFDANPKLNIIPLHLLQHWDEMKGHEGYLHTVYQVLNGIDHPLQVQIENLNQLLALKKLTEQRTLMVGDFNVPDQWFLTEPATFKHLKSGWTFTKPTGGRSNSFKNYFTLDHAFSSDLTEVQCTKILEYKGSDHYPLMIDVQ